MLIAKYDCRGSGHDITHITRTWAKDGQSTEGKIYVTLQRILVQKFATTVKHCIKDRA